MTEGLPDMGEIFKDEFKLADRLKIVENELLNATHLLAAVVHHCGGEVTLSREVMLNAPRGAMLVVHNDHAAMTVTLKLIGMEEGGNSDAGDDDRDS